MVLFYNSTDIWIEKKKKNKVVPADKKKKYFFRKTELQFFLLLTENRASVLHFLDYINNVFSSSYMENINYIQL